MLNHVSLRPIISDRFRPFRLDSGRRFSFMHFALTFVLPVLVATWVCVRYPVIDKEYQVTLLTIFGIIAAVLTALLPIVQSVVGNFTLPERYTPAQSARWQNQRVRLEVLRGLYSAISWAVVLLVLSLVPMLLLQVESFPGLLKRFIAFLIYFVALSVAVCFLEIVVGVYQVLEDQARQIAQQLKDARPPE
jgi:hypothetical protein